MQDPPLLQKTAAREMGMEPNTLSRYELGEREPDAETLVKLAEYYGTTTDYLLGRANNPNLPEERENGVMQLVPHHARDRVEAFSELGEIADRAGLSSEQITKLIKVIAEVIAPPKGSRKSSLAAHMESPQPGQVAGGCVDGDDNH
jgi:transcriptional regulator with XRE-family HTH domain